MKNKNSTNPFSIRVSIGSATVLGIKSIEINTLPTTCYLMTVSKKKCIGKCLFCPQSSISDPKITNQLSRIQWPEFKLKKVIIALEKLQNSDAPEKFKRICLQVLNYPKFFKDVISLIRKIHQITPSTPISCAIPPISFNQIRQLKNVGLNTIAFALDACIPELFSKIKGKEIEGPYRWDSHQYALKNAIKIFGKNHVSTHLIVGLGETEKEMSESLFDVINRGIQPGIFFFMPVKGTPLYKKKKEPIQNFRHIQLIRRILLDNLSNKNRFVFNAEEQLIKIKNLSENELKTIVQESDAFETAGCPGCNRPYYTSRPGEEQDGYPRPLNNNEKNKVFHELKSLID